MNSNLTDLPIEMTQLSVEEKLNVRTINLNGNQFDKIPEEIVKFSNLTELFMSDNEI